MAAPAIRWEVENGFRYLRNAKDFREIARIYKEEQRSHPQPSALQLELALERATSRDNGFNSVSGADRRLGWAASIYLNTCGRQRDHTHASCELTDNESYLEPKTTRVILHVDGIASGTCEWTVDGVRLGTASCNDVDDQGGAQPQVATVTYGVKHDVTVTPAGGGSIAGEILVKDILIASFGNSYSSGEGNPERPVSFSNDFSDYGRSSRHGIPPRVDQFPVRKPGPEFWGDNAANWTNSQCHRSLYSQHAKAALHYALEHPHVTVTFLNYSCTGAEVFQGILNSWWARDVSTDHWDDAPQLVKALRDLCKDRIPYMETQWSKGDRNDSHFNSKKADFPKCERLIDRKIDALLLSIGGNDIGFANMIANTTLNVPNTVPLIYARPWVYGVWRKATRPQTFSEGRRKARQLLPSHYNELSKQLRAYLSLDTNRVVLSAYPDVSTNERGQTCQSKRLGMDVHAVFGMNNPDASNQSEAFVEFLHDFMKAQAAKQGWHFADQHFANANAPNNFRGHGLCAKGAPGELEPDKGISMQFPRPPLPQSPPFEWKPFYPILYAPYTQRNRWLVTPNDSYLATQYLDPHLDVFDPVQPLYSSTLSGSFHPNALGHAALADSVLLELRAILENGER